MSIIKLHQERIDEFWSRTRLDGDCLLWTAGKTGHGYGVFFADGKNRSAHRISYELTHGEVPDGLILRHTCDRPACVNPNHLITGTHLDNTRDKMERGRHRTPIGVDHCRAKIDETAVLHIRQLRASGYTYKEIGDGYGISKTAVAMIATGETWKHIGGPLTPQPKKKPAICQDLPPFRDDEAARRRCIGSNNCAARYAKLWGCSIEEAAREFELPIDRVLASWSHLYGEASHVTRGTGDQS